jgi:hypothetical protein
MLLHSGSRSGLELSIADHGYKRRISMSANDLTITKVNDILQIIYYSIWNIEEIEY